MTVSTAVQRAARILLCDPFISNGPNTDCMLGLRMWKFLLWLLVGSTAMGLVSCIMERKQLPIPAA